MSIVAYGLMAIGPLPYWWIPNKGLRSHAILKKYCMGAIPFSISQIFHFLFFEFFNNFFIKWLRLKVKKLTFNLNHSIGIACNTNYMASQSQIRGSLLGLVFFRYASPLNAALYILPNILFVS